MQKNIRLFKAPEIRFKDIGIEASLRDGSVAGEDRKEGQTRKMSDGIILVDKPVRLPHTILSTSFDVDWDKEDRPCRNTGPFASGLVISRVNKGNSDSRVLS